MSNSFHNENEPSHTIFNQNYLLSDEQYQNLINKEEEIDSSLLDHNNDYQVISNAIQKLKNCNDHDERAINVIKLRRARRNLIHQIWEERDPLKEQSKQYDSLQEQIEFQKLYQTKCQEYLYHLQNTSDPFQNIELPEIERTEPSETDHDHTIKRLQKEFDDRLFLNNKHAELQLIKKQKEDEIKSKRAKYDEKIVKINELIEQIKKISEI